MDGHSLPLHLQDGSCKVALGSTGNGETITAVATEMDMVLPKKSDKIKIMNGPQRGATGKLIGIDGTDGIVKVDYTFDVKILDMVILAKLAPWKCTWSLLHGPRLYIWLKDFFFLFFFGAMLYGSQLSAECT